MAHRFHKVSTRLRDSLLLLDNSSVPVTGEVPAGFTITSVRLGVGDIAITGITIAEIDAINDPGQYSLDFDPLTSFVNSTGTFIVTVLNIAENRWFDVLVEVTSDGTGTGTLGPNVFTAATADGRITDGVSPVEDATVYILDTNNLLVTAVQTDASGLWGPIYVDDGSYTVTAQKSAFTGASGVLVATGGGGSIGADIVITAIGGAGTITNGDLISYARRQSGDKGGSKANIQLQECVNAALKKVAKEHFSQWYQTDAKLLLRQNFQTGTISINQATQLVTLVGGVWPAWAANGELLINGNYMPVNTRDSDTEITLVNEWVEANVVAQSFTLMQFAYPMPADLLAVGKDVWYKGSIQFDSDPSTYNNIQSAKRLTGRTLSHKMWCPHRKNFIIWPTASSDSYADYFYYRAPILLTFDNPSEVADMDPLNIDLIHRAIDVELMHEGIYAGSNADPRDAYQKELLLSKRNDSNTTGQNRVRGNRRGGGSLGSDYLR